MYIQIFFFLNICFSSKIPGGRLEESKVLDGILLNKDVTHPRMRRYPLYVHFTISRTNALNHIQKEANSIIFLSRLPLVLYGHQSPQFKDITLGIEFDNKQNDEKHFSLYFKIH